MHGHRVKPQTPFLFYFPCTGGCRSVLLRQIRGCMEKAAQLGCPGAGRLSPLGDAGQSCSPLLFSPLFSPSFLLSSPLLWDLPGSGRCSATAAHMDSIRAELISSPRGGRWRGTGLPGAGKSPSHCKASVGELEVPETQMEEPRMPFLESLFRVEIR